MATKRHFRFPTEKIRDGTFLDLTRLDWQLYAIIASHINYETHDSGVSYRTIRKESKVTSGARILTSIEHLMELGLIRSWVVPFIRKDGSQSDTQTKRLYHVRIGNEHTN